MADTKKLKKTVGKSAVRNTIQISAGDRIYYAIVNVLLGVFTIIVLMPLLNVLGRPRSRRPRQAQLRLGSVLAGRLQPGRLRSRV